MARKGVIYLYTFPNGKVYVGQTRRDPQVRHREHLDPKIGPTNSAFWKAYQEQGEPKYEIFNYTHTAQIYKKTDDSFEVIHIHGDIDDKEHVIFGYGDEMHSDFEKLKEREDGECLRYVKSIRYLEASNYKKLLRFIDSAPFQVVIMGHSCGRSDRTLLHTIFEHGNCASIKLCYYRKEDSSDDYLEKIQNISRNFVSMERMRDVVVPKPQCNPLKRDIIEVG